MQTVNSAITHIIETIWSSFLDLEVQPVDRCIQMNNQETILTSRMDIEGDWEGTIMLTCPDTLARRAASTMFHISEDALSPDEVQDARGELVNIFSGNFKEVLPGMNRLTLPVTEVRSGDFSIPASTNAPDMQDSSDMGVQAKMEFECLGHVFMVTIREKNVE